MLGAPVATGTLAAVMAEGARGLDGFVEVVRAGLATAPVAHFDETGVRVAGRLHWVHSTSTSLLSLFTVHAKRGKVAMDQAGVLPVFGGVAVHDGWAPYWRYQDATHALCGAHLLRELEAISDEPGQGWAAGMAAAPGCQFQPFQRLGDAGGSGVGLGLAVARGFLDAMHGQITPDDTLGGGLTMRIRLPITNGQPDQEADR
jgi:hypothetical protein